MKIRDIVEHFLSRADWVDRSRTVDRVIIGKPEADVDRCLVTWMPGMAALREAVRRGLPLVLAHEPTFYDHWDDRPGGARDVDAKKRYIEEQGLTIVRLHDTWDRWPQIGIPWAWARFLGMERPPAAVGGNGYQHRYDIAPVPLGEFARRMAARCAAIGEPAVQVTGDDAQPVSRIGVGTGCGCDLAEFRRMECDCSIVCDDGSCYWAGIQRAKDDVHPVIRVNHGTSEEPGMATLAQYVNEHLPLQATHYVHGSVFHLVGAG